MNDASQKRFLAVQQGLWFGLDEWGLSTCRRTLLGLFAVLAVTLAFFGAEHIRAIRAGLQAQSDALGEQNRKNARLAEAVRGQKDLLARFVRGMDTTGKTRNWLETMQGSLRKHHLHLEELQMKPTRRLQIYAKHPFCLRAQGAYRNVKAWLWRWSARPYPGTVPLSVQLQHAHKGRVLMEVCGAYYQKRR